MASLILRLTKGSPLTNAEVDGNFSALNTELATKITASSADTLTNKVLDDISNEIGANHLHFKVKATQNLVSGDVVKVTGYNAGENAYEVAKMTATTDVAIGIIDGTIAIGGFGAVVNTGLLEGFDTSAFTVGQILYPNGTGGLTATQPTSGTYQAIAFVLRSHAVNGAALVEASAPTAVRTSSNTGNTVVLRDASGNFSAGTITAALSGNASTATSAGKWTTARTLSFTGDATGSGSVDGSANVATSLTLANSGVTAGVYGGNNAIPSITFDAKGRATSAGTVTPSGTWGISISGNAATATRVTGGNLNPASTAFNNALIAASGSNRVVTFDGNGSLPSVWWSNGATAVGAIDGNSGGGLQFWANNGTTWQQQATVGYGTFNVLTALQQGGNQVLHAGNYNSYVPTLTGGGASGTWGISISGNAASASSVAWTNVSGRPTAVSSFTNDSGYITSSTLNDYTNGAYRVIADYSGSNTWYIRSNGRFTWARGHDWTQTFELNLESGTAASNNGWAEFGQRQSNNAAGTWYGTRFVQYTGSTKTDGHIRAGNHYLGADNSYITNAGDSSARVQTAYGYIDIGPKNGSWCHIYSDKTFYFNQELYVNNVQVVKNSGTWGISITGSAASASTSSQVTINYNNDSNSTYQMLWGSGNSVYGTGGIYCNPSSDYLYAGSFYCGNWFRSSGGTGWYNESYAGGVYMIDTTWVRTYNNKSIYTAGEIAAAGNVTAYYSDMRLKTKVGGIENALDKVDSLEGFYYVENELAKSFGYKNEKQQVALSAQAVKAVMPEAVSLAAFDMETHETTGEITSKSGEEYLTVDYARLVPLLVEAIKELRAEVKALKG